jgi:class 3 adenylate cyclase
MSRHLVDPRRSFAAKVVAAVLGTVGLLLVLMLLVVRSETAGQIERVSERTVDGAREAFAESEARRREQLAERARVFTDTRRTLALLEEAIHAGETEELASQIRYELDLRRFGSTGLIGLTDPDGAPVMTLLGEGVTVRGDPAGLVPLAVRLLESQDTELVGYRLVDGQLYTVRVVLIELARRVVGTIAFGLPIGDGDAEVLGRVVGAEICFVAAGQCVAGTPLARGELAASLVGLAGRPEHRLVTWGGERWELLADPLPGAETSAWLVMAVPLEPVLRPFDRIRRALALGSGVALLLALLMSVLLSRGLTRPVRALVDATNRVARGDYSARVPSTSPDEIGQLARSFNTMAEGLGLKEQYRAVLDKVVSREVADELIRGDARLGGESRDVTILFADLRGFTALTEGMKANRIIDLLNDTMARLSAAVEETGGVVDKYIGDQIMAVFGAPVGQADHPARAVAAGQAMQRAIAALNEERTARGEAPVGLGVGVHSGVVVAGNMGSSNRLNYTVLGNSVNLAARLCAAAEPGQVLISEATRWRLDGVDVRPVGEREFKGFSHRIPVYAVAPEGVAHGGSAGPGARILLALVLGAGLASGPGSGALVAQTPTLSELGLGYISADGMVQLDLSGRADLELYAPSSEPAWMIPDTDPFLAGRVRLFGDLFLGERIFASTELRVDRGEEPRAGPWDARMDQAFLRVGPFGPVSVQLGKFVSPFGGYPQRHHTTQDPFVRPPLMYDYRTVITTGGAPGSTDAFLGWKDGDPREFRPEGAPPVWGAPYQWGGMLLAGGGPVSVRLAAMNSAPGSEPSAWGWDGSRLSHPSLVAGATARLSPSLRLDAWYNRGPYLEPTVEAPLDDGRAYHDYVQ